ncbi:MAG TPA: ATP-binding protein [Burkholderiales bacterium]|nr:ATP-binding protein [Burkholderiales bacterium]
MTASRRFAPGIRAKVLLASSALLLIPWIGYAFVAEMERFLGETQARMLAENARAVATVVQERATVTPSDAQVLRAIAPALAQPIALDGALDDWRAQQAESRPYASERLVELHGSWTPASLSFAHAIGVHGGSVFAFFDVTDDRVVYCTTDAASCDHLRVSIQRSGQAFQRYTVDAPAPGPVRVLSTYADAEPIEGVWRERERGYTLELKLPASGLQQLGFAVADVDEVAGRVSAVIATEERLSQDRTGFEITADVAAVLEGIARAKLRIWLLDSVGSVVLRTGDIEGVPDPLARASRVDTPEVQSALSGQPALRTHEDAAAEPRINAAAHPVQVGGETIGAALVEQTSESIATIRSLALERLLLATLAAFVGGALILVIYVTRVSHRLRRLRDEADRAIDSAGRVRELAAGSTARDEIGDLSRSYSAVLKRLAQYTDYLENLARRLNHELRTPIAIVRSSLDNLRSETLPSGAGVYIERAEAGLDRLAAILSRMSEATRLEEIMGRTERETFDLDQVVRGCAEGYRLAYAPLEIRYDGPGRPVTLDGVPDLIAQMLDKLVENAAEYAEPGTPVEIALEDAAEAVIRVRNQGPPLPAAMEGRLFESMVSVEGGKSSGIPHLGLGLYIVKLIAQFHGGTASAKTRSDTSGVEVTVTLSRT